MRQRERDTYARRLRGVADAIEAHPRNFSMRVWYDGIKQSAAKRFRPKAPECGTTACIAGWTLAMFDPAAEKRAQELLEDGQSLDGRSFQGYILIAERAAELLGLPEADKELVYLPDAMPETARGLFYMSGGVKTVAKKLRKIADEFERGDRG